MPAQDTFEEIIFQNNLSDLNKTSNYNFTIDEQFIDESIPDFSELNQTRTSSINNKLIAWYILCLFLTIFFSTLSFLSELAYFKILMAGMALLLQFSMGFLIGYNLKP